jgi:hypothetical protein
VSGQPDTCQSGGGFGRRGRQSAARLRGRFIAINPRATPLLARRIAQSSNLDELLFALIVLGDDRAVANTLVQGQVVDPVLHSFHESDGPPADHPAVGA